MGNLNSGCSYLVTTVSFYFIVQEHTRIVGAFVQGSDINSEESLLGWFTVCPGSNQGDDTFELCIAGHNEHRLYYDKTHK